VTGVSWPEGFRLERLAKRHRRGKFNSGQAQVDEWLATKALQQQDKHLSSTKVLLAADNSLVGYYTLATGQVDFSDLPHDIARRLPHRLLPVAVLAWLGVDRRFRRQGFGCRLLAQALADCHAAGEAFPFVAVILDCVDATAKAFYKSFDFDELPGHPFRLFLSAAKLDAMMRA
jgi:GNAT superfamily N-acetyltransferase